MTMTEARQANTEDEATVRAATAGDEGAFSKLFTRHRKELHVHCYRMLGSLQDTEDVVQETFLRAWRKRDTYEGRSTFRAWLYRIATNACLDHIDRANRRAPDPTGIAGPGGPGAPRPTRAFEVPWLEPYPDRLLEGLVASEPEPGEAVVTRETIELAFMVAIQQLPPRQRAALIARDVLGWSAKEAASMLEMSVASINSALQRARQTMREHLPPARQEWAAGTDPTAEERALLDRYLQATADDDFDAFVDMMREDAVFAMPPEPGVYVGAQNIVEGWQAGGPGSPEWGRMAGVWTRANMQPAFACYLRRPGDDAYRPLAMDVLRIEEGKIAEITTFPGSVFEHFDLPELLEA